MQFAALLGMSLRETLDSKIFWVVAAISVLIALTMVCVGVSDDQISIVFGMWNFDLTQGGHAGMGREALLTAVVFLLIGFVVGKVGIMLMIIATGSLIPTFLRDGRVDVLLGKPIGRKRLFLYKYLTSMVFVAIQASLFVGLTFLVMWLRWGIWVPGYLLAMPLLVLLFSYVFCISALVAVKTRSPVAAILVSIGVWMTFAMMQKAPVTIELLMRDATKTPVYRALAIAAEIPPKTTHIEFLAARWAGIGFSMNAVPPGTSELGDELSQPRYQEAEQQFLDVDPVYSIGSSLLFEAFIVGWAMWCFARKDY